MDDIQKQILELARKADVPDPIHYVDYAVEELAMETLNRFIKTCDYCEGCSKGTKSIVGGNPHAAIMVIGECVLQGQKDNDFVRPFENTAEADLIQDVLDEFNVNPEQLLWMNVVNCFTHKVVNGKKLKRAPKTSERENCQTYIDYAIDAFKPLYILVLGNIAMNVFKSGVVGKEHGEWFAVRDTIPAIATYSPTYIRQMEENGNEFAKDYKYEFREDIKHLLLDVQDQYPDSDILLKPISK